MDFKKLDVIGVAEKGFDYVFIDPRDGTETDVVISVIGAGSRTYKQADAKIEAYKAQCYKRGKSPDDEVLEDLNIKLVASCTRDWKGVEEDGKPIKFSYDEAVRMYKAYPLLTNQVIGAIHDVVNQLEGNSKT